MPFFCTRQAIADAGTGVVVSGGKIGEMALHYINKYGMMAVRLVSKWDIRRLAKATGIKSAQKMQDVAYAQY